MFDLSTCSSTSFTSPDIQQPIEKELKGYEIRAKEYIDVITLSGTRLRQLLQKASEQLQAGLNMHRQDPLQWHPEQSDFMMLDCCLNALPTGREKGTFYAIDLGGTNLRTLRVTLDGHGEMTIKQTEANIRNFGVSANSPYGVLDKSAPATMLFDAIANQLKGLMMEAGDLKKRETADLFPVGFTFSFGISQPALDVAILGQWSKGFETGEKSDDPVVGRDVCELLNQAFRRLDVPGKVCCVLNDTTGTLIGAAVTQPRHLPPCTIGLILGTGINACYYEPDADLYNYIGKVINVEIGGFKQDLPVSLIDAELDFLSSNRGFASLEKMVSGLYVAECVRLLIIQVFQKRAPNSAWTVQSLPTWRLAQIYAASSFDANAVTAEVMADCLEWKASTSELNVVKELVDAVFDRSACLSAVIVTALAKRTRRLQPAMGGVTVGVDGSLFNKNPKYQAKVRETITTLLGHQLGSLIYFHPTNDGSGKGAACLAATVSTCSR